MPREYRITPTKLRLCIIKAPVDPLLSELDGLFERFQEMTCDRRGVTLDQSQFCGDRRFAPTRFNDQASFRSASARVAASWSLMMDWTSGCTVGFPSRRMNWHAAQLAAEFS
jgi:hypothetical protein